MNSKTASSYFKAKIAKPKARGDPAETAVYTLSIGVQTFTPTFPFNNGAWGFEYQPTGWPFCPISLFRFQVSPNRQRAHRIPPEKDIKVNLYEAIGGEGRDQQLFAIRWTFSPTTRRSRPNRASHADRFIGRTAPSTGQAAEHRRYDFARLPDHNRRETDAAFIPTNRTAFSFITVNSRITCATGRSTPWWARWTSGPGRHHDGGEHGRWCGVDLSRMRALGR